MLEKITYYQILGKPLIFYLGIMSVLLLLFTASLPYLGKRQIVKNHFRMHRTAAIITVSVALVHGILAFTEYL